MTWCNTDSHSAVYTVVNRFSSVAHLLSPVLQNLMIYHRSFLSLLWIRWKFGQRDLRDFGHPKRERMKFPLLYLKFKSCCIINFIKRTCFLSK